MDSVITALNALYGQDAGARTAANAWLQDWAKTPEAWATCNVLLTTADVPTEPKLFAAQTFRSKITYDLGDLSTEHRLALRDSLKHALTMAGMAAVVVRQIALSLADLLLQLPEWDDAVREVIGLLGADVETVPALLEFLIVLPEEATQNGRVDVTNENVLSRDNALAVLALLPTYLGGYTPPKLRKQAFLCFASWLRAGALPAQSSIASPLFGLAFESLASEDLYDEASAAVCDLIHETQEVDDNVAVIEQILPRLVALAPLLVEHVDDVDRVRALCKVFAEAGETYSALVVRHTATFQPIVEALAQCARHEDLDIVRLTFSFWWKLAESLKLTKGEAPAPVIVQTYARLVDDIIGHLRYPADGEPALSAQERDDFREFRHAIGDTLKDCCAVLGAVACLQRANDLVQAGLADFERSHNWQAIEAPLFAMRSMGAKVDAHEATILPTIIATLPALPAHPRIRYATILVIARYTEWINEHPDTIPSALTFVSSGFSDAESDVWLAAAQAMKFLCEDCGRHLVPYVPQLHAFIDNVGPKLPPEDLGEVSEGIANVIAAMDTPSLCHALPLFTLPLVEAVKRFIPMDLAKSKPDQQALDDVLGRLAKYLEICSRPGGLDLPPACAQTAADAWLVIDELLLRHGHLRGVSENVCAVLRRAIDFFDVLLAPLVGKMAARLASAFTTSGRPAFLWITGRLPALAARAPSPELLDALRGAFEAESAKVFELLPQKPLAENEDVVDDYCHMLPSLLRSTPDIVLLSPSLRGALAVAVSALGLLNPALVRIGLDVILDFAGHDCLEASRPPGAPQAAALRQVLALEGPAIVASVVNGIVTEWEDTSGAVTLARVLAERCGPDFAGWVAAGVDAVPGKVLSAADRQAFLAELGGACQRGNLNEVRSAFVQLDRLSRRAKQRAALDRRRSELDSRASSG